MELITPYQLTPKDSLSSLVEHRTKFNLDVCELNIFETHQKASDFNLRFGGFTITSMLRGKKIMHLDGFEDFEYLPGQTVLAPSDTLMRIDFPEAEENNPTRCTALVIDEGFISSQLELINSKQNRELVTFSEWRLDFSDATLQNNKDLAFISNNILHVLTSDDPLKDYQADLMLRKLVVCLLKLQNLNGLQKYSTKNSTQSPFHAVLHHISTQLSQDIRIADLCKIAGMSKSALYRAFTEQYGITPVQLILEERIKYAKNLLENPDLSVKEIAFSCGFNDPNYFSRMFKQVAGVRPSEYRLGLGAALDMA